MCHSTHAPVFKDVGISGTIPNLRRDPMAKYMGLGRILATEQACRSGLKQSTSSRRRLYKSESLVSVGVRQQPLNSHTEMLQRLPHPPRKPRPYLADARVGTAGKSLRPKSVTYVLGTLCNPCVRAGPAPGGIRTPDLLVRSYTLHSYRLVTPP
jgi:hypothetical protein